jgi:hypothetical protein
MKIFKTLCGVGPSSPAKGKEKARKTAPKNGLEINFEGKFDL